ncbi:hypothetical protein ACJ72_00491 [Emergomyces africanus]|uniref:Aminoglycoside phosphotransferase domain-containing protein n=1 Tax=Emergomyces africanus TaxID=1955775 RepID=A0A1B7P812_9EURO|nr:hypothetical protein ACJ72_00491 [Emergomyces africanus]
MTRLNGHTLGSVFHRISYQEQCVRQLRCIPNWTPYRLASTIGGPIIDHRIPDGTGGPFATESEFNKHLVHQYVGEETKNFIAATHSRDHRSFFAHADLHPSNILIDRGRLSGIVDWECAGYYPEYWKFTKAMFGVWNITDKEKIWRNTFGDDYDEELKAEQRRMVSDFYAEGVETFIAFRTNEVKVKRPGTEGSGGISPHSTSHQPYEPSFDILTSIGCHFQQ